MGVNWSSVLSFAKMMIRGAQLLDGAQTLTISARLGDICKRIEDPNQIATIGEAAEAIELGKALRDKGVVLDADYDDFVQEIDPDRFLRDRFSLE